jgi:hypothetical protein
MCPPGAYNASACIIILYAPSKLMSRKKASEIPETFGLENFRDPGNSIFNIDVISLNKYQYDGSRPF